MIDHPAPEVDPDWIAHYNAEVARRPPLIRARLNELKSEILRPLRLRLADADQAQWRAGVDDHQRTVVEFAALHALVKAIEQADYEGR